MVQSILYQAYELAHAAVYPWRQAARLVQAAYTHPASPLAYSPVSPVVQAGCRLFGDLTSRYAKPEFGIDHTSVDGIEVPVRERAVRTKPFCTLVHFEREPGAARRRRDPRVLIIAPMSGHYATLLRGTVRAMLPDHDTYITDWADARGVPLAAGAFGTEDYVDYLMEFLRFLGPGTHVLAVCQPAPLALAATALLAMGDEPCQPRSLTLMAGPVDTRCNPTVVNEHALAHPLDWFRTRVITRVPFPHWGALRAVYPGFLQLSGFMAMNLDRHVDAYREYFGGLVAGDADGVQQHQKFYDEYLAVMDLDARFFLETVEHIFQRHLLPRGELTHRGEIVDCAAISRTALMTVEGEADDICGRGQTEAAHALCPNVTADETYRYVQARVGHYGVFNGTRWRTEIQPRIREMIRTVDARRREH